MRKALTVIAVVLVIILIGGGVVQWLRTSDQAPIDDPFAGGPTAERTPGDEAPSSEPEWCPAVQVISAPGTWESAPDDDPFNPQANPNSFMLSITQPLQEAYPIEQVRVWTVPYTAQFRNIQADHEMSYDDSREEGTRKVKDELRFVGETCPSTEFLLTGFSQGAVILGDVVSEIGQDKGPVSADRIRGAALIADGRRENGVGQNPGVELSGVGAEIALQPVNGLIQFVTPGATMRGARSGGFGALDNRVQQICSPDDAICDAPQDIGNGIERARDLIDAHGVHAMYAHNDAVIPGTTADAWVVDWAHNLINNPPER